MKPLLLLVCIFLTFQDAFPDEKSSLRAKRQLYRDDIPVKPRRFRPGGEEKDKADAELNGHQDVEPIIPVDIFSFEDINYPPKKTPSVNLHQHYKPIQTPSHVPSVLQEHEPSVYQNHKPLVHEKHKQVHKPSPVYENPKPVKPSIAYEEHQPAHKPTQVYEERKPLQKPFHSFHEDKPIYKPNPVHSKPQHIGFENHFPQHKPQLTFEKPTPYQKPIHQNHQPVYHEPKPINKPKVTHQQHAYKPKPAYEEPYHKPKYHKDGKKSGIPGIPGEDYPIYNEVPYTSFSCKEVPFRPGMYVNVESGCQAYHVCHDERHGPQGASFLCTNGTLFNQETFNCDWWYNVDCSKGKSLYGLNSDPKFNPYYQKPHEPEIPYHSPSKFSYNKELLKENQHTRKAPLFNHQPPTFPNSPKPLYTIKTQHQPNFQTNPLAKNKPFHSFDEISSPIATSKLSKNIEPIEQFQIFQENKKFHAETEKSSTTNEPINQYSPQGIIQHKVNEPKPFQSSVFEGFGPQPYEIKPISNDKPSNLHISAESKPTNTYNPDINKRQASPPRRRYQRRPTVQQKESSEELKPAGYEDEPENAYKSLSSGPITPVSNDKKQGRPSSSYKSKHPFPQRRQRPQPEVALPGRSELRYPKPQLFDDRRSENIKPKARDSNENVPDENLDYEWGEKI